MRKHRLRNVNPRVRFGGWQNLGVDWVLGVDLQLDFCPAYCFVPIVFDFNAEWNLNTCLQYRRRLEANVEIGIPLREG